MVIGRYILNSLSLEMTSSERFSKRNEVASELWKNESVTLHTLTPNIYALFEGLVCRGNTLLVLPRCLVINTAEEIKIILLAFAFLLLMILFKIY